jgi:hypothetical protein
MTQLSDELKTTLIVRDLAVVVVVLESIGFVVYTVVR